MSKIIIRSAGKKDIENVQAFLVKQLAEFFGQKRSAPLGKDVWALEESYIWPKRNQLFGAFSPDGEVVGTLGVIPYNGRFAELAGRYQEEKTAEIGRCYIDATLRRQGVGGRLFQEAISFCKEQDYEMMYLHTHYFLPGGFSFWKKVGFKSTVEIGGTLEMVHMERAI